MEKGTRMLVPSVCPLQLESNQRQQQIESQLAPATAGFYHLLASNRQKGARNNKHIEG